MIKNSLLSKAAILGLALASIGSAIRVQAETIYGITDSAQLFSFDSASPGTISSLTTVTGITSGQSLVGIDFRPATGQLYGLSYEASGAAQLYVIDLASGLATPVGSGFSLAAGNPSARFAFDFNPSVDRIRVIGGDNTNYRLHPVTGALAFTDTNVAYASGDPAFGMDPLIASAAYTNNVAGGTPTTLYAYDFFRDTLVTVGSVNGSPDSPNGGLLFSVGSSGLAAFSGSMGFDISGGTGVGYYNIDLNTTAPADNLYTVNLGPGVGAGTATLVGAIGAPSVLDISVFIIPEPSAVALFLLAGAGVAVVLWRRRKTVV